MEKTKISLPQDSSAGVAYTSSRFSPDHTTVLVRASAPGRVVSMTTCAKVCAVSFVVGVFVGFTLNRRFRRWLNKQLRRLRDD